MITVHFEGYASEYDVTVDRSDPLQCIGIFAKYHSISCRPNSEIPELEIGSFVEVKSGAQWKPCEIQQWDTGRKQGQSGQFKISSSSRKRWYHPDDTKNVRKWRTPSAAIDLSVSMKRKMNDETEYRSYPSVKRQHIDRECPSERACDVDVRVTDQQSGERQRETIKSDVGTWTVEDVVLWFEERGFVNEMRSLKGRFRQWNINGVAFLSLTREDLYEVGFEEWIHTKAILKLRHDEFGGRL